MTPIDLELQLRPYGRALAEDLVRDRDVADDLVQATTECALERPPAHPGPLGGWFATIFRRQHRFLDFEGLTPSGTAARTGAGDATVKSRLHRGRLDRSCGGCRRRSQS